MQKKKKKKTLYFDGNTPYISAHQAVYSLLFSHLLITFLLDQ